MTKERILDAAEKLFAQKGFDGASLREITAAASTNLASVNYHFGSKEDLIAAVLRRRMRPLNERRIALLAAAEAAHSGAPPPLTEILTAFYGPVVELIGRPECHFQPLLGRVFFEHGRAWECFREEILPVVERFLAALRKALPHLEPEILAWRFQFAGAVLGFTMAGPRFFPLPSSGGRLTTDAGEVTRRMVEFAAAGLRAPVHHRSFEPCTALSPLLS